MCVPIVFKNILENVNYRPNEKNLQGICVFTFDLSLLKFAYTNSWRVHSLLYFSPWLAHKLDSLLVARPSGDGAHNSKKVFRLFPKRNIVFLCCAVKIKREKKNIYRCTNGQEKIHFWVRIFLADPHPIRQIEKYRATIIKFFMSVKIYTTILRPL